MKVIQYTIKAVVNDPVDYPEGIGDLMDRIREVGEAVVEKVEIVEVKE